MSSVLLINEFFEIQSAGLTSNLSTADIARIRNFNTNASVAAPEPGSLTLLLPVLGAVLCRRPITPVIGRRRSTVVFSTLLICYSATGKREHRLRGRESGCF